MTLRLILAFIIGFLASSLIGVFLVPYLRRIKAGQSIREDGPKWHMSKTGTPTMGGLIILLSVLVTCAILADWTPQLILAVVATMLTGALGLLDDIESVAHARSLGLTPSQKMAGLIAISVGFCLYAVNVCHIAPTISFPGGFSIDLGVLTTEIPIGVHLLKIPWLYLIFVFLLMAGLSNAVNLTDGLDGLAGGCSMVVMLVMAMVAFRFGQLGLAIFAAAFGGACLGFLWYNCYPATIFMGDTGSLALGAAFAALAVLTKTEVTSLVMGGLFITEALSVIIQVASFKSTGKRVFRMSPIHHHFELGGWSEWKVVFVFWTVGLLASIAALELL